MAAHTCGSGPRAEQVALESVDRIRLNRAPHTEFKFLLGAGASSIGQALEYFRRVASAFRNPLVKVLAQEREFLSSPADSVYYLRTVHPGRGPYHGLPGGRARHLSNATL